MKIKVFYFIDKNIEDPEMMDRKKQILEIMNKFDQYIEYEKFAKEYQKIKSSLIYKKNKDKLSKRRKTESVFCQVCNKSIQKKAYYESHVFSPFHLNNEKDSKLKNKNNIKEKQEIEEENQLIDEQEDEIIEKEEELLEQDEISDN
jgi:hypothetical protein